MKIMSVAIYSKKAISVIFAFLILLGSHHALGQEAIELAENMVFEYSQLTLEPLKEYLLVVDTKVTTEPDFDEPHESVDVYKELRSVSREIRWRSVDRDATLYFPNDPNRKVTGLATDCEWRYLDVGEKKYFGTPTLYRNHPEKNFGCPFIEVFEWPFTGSSGRMSSDARGNMDDRFGKLLKCVEAVEIGSEIRSVWKPSNGSPIVVFIDFKDSLPVKVEHRNGQKLTADFLHNRKRLECLLENEISWQKIEDCDLPKQMRSTWIYGKGLLFFEATFTIEKNKQRFQKVLNQIMQDKAVADKIFVEASANKDAKK